METFIKDFSLEGANMARENDDLEHLITLRQERFHLTAEHKKNIGKIMDLLNKLEDMPEAKEIAGDLDEEITHLECISYSAAYRDGMIDLMGTLTINKIGITAVECFKRRF